MLRVRYDLDAVAWLYCNLCAEILYTHRNCGPIHAIAWIPEQAQATVHCRRERLHWLPAERALA
jgi:hypothetical protein